MHSEVIFQFCPSRSVGGVEESEFLLDVDFCSRSSVFGLGLACQAEEAKPKAKVIIPKSQLCQSIYGKPRVKVRSTACNASDYAKKKKAPLENKNMFGFEHNN